MKHLLLITLLFFSFDSFARDWFAYDVPFARCADSQSYKVFVSPGTNPKKVAIEFMGGGACWSAETCWGPKLVTWIHPIPKIPAYSYLTSSSSPLKDHTIIYLPYCTGDVWMGNHSADYGNGRLTHHEGENNFTSAIFYLKQFYYFKNIEELVVFGSSAGAIGALANIHHLNKLAPTAQKIMIADSPGLHWNEKFWHKFTSHQLQDYTKKLKKTGLNLNPNDGLLAPQIKNFCRRYEDWKIGFIQSTEDVVMANVFGQMDSMEHRLNVLGPHGLRHNILTSPNCSVHTPDGKGHAFLLLKQYSWLQSDMFTKQGLLEYVQEILN